MGFDYTAIHVQPSLFISDKKVQNIAQSIWVRLNGARGLHENLDTTSKRI